MNNKIIVCLSCWIALLMPFVAMAQTIDTPTAYYLMHSSGNHLAMSSQGGGVLEAAGAASPQKITFIPAGDGYYNLQSADGTGYLALTGSWNTSFIADATSDKAKYAIEKASKSYIKLRCKYNDKYLGTDDVNDGASVYSDKGGTDTRHFWYLSDDPKQLPPTDTAVYVVNPAVQRQQFEGWGVSLCWWANMCGKWSDDKIDELVDWLVSPEGLDYRIFRYNIGGGDDPNNANCTLHHMGNGKGLRAEMEGFKDSTGGNYIWSRDSAQRKIMLKIKERRPDAIFEAFSNSCPYYMTYSGCCAGNSDASKDNLKPEYYEEFAHYLVDVCRHYKDEYGIEFRTLEPFNEPVTSYWGASGSQEGCHFDVSSQIAFLKVLQPILAESGLNTVIAASDETATDQSVTTFEGYQNAGVLPLVGQWNTHTYSATQESRSQIGALCKAEGIRLWMSEVGSGGSGIAGNLNLAQKLIDDVRYIMPAAWVDWQYVEEGNDQWCLVQGNFTEQTYHKVKNYSIRQHFSKFIHAGYTFLTSLNGQTLAARNEAGDSLVIVVINPTATATVHRADLRFYQSVDAVLSSWLTTETADLVSFTNYELNDRILSYKLPAYSVATFVLSVKEAADQSNAIVTDAPYWICPRNAADLAVEAVDGAVVLQTVAQTPEQTWTLKTADGGYSFTNGNGDIITAQSSYALTCSTEQQDGQTFAIIPIDDLFYKITTTDSTKAFDLENARYTAGTAVGLWAYGTSPTASHRQWLLMRQPVDENGNGIVGVDMGGEEAPVRLVCDVDGQLRVENPSGALCLLAIYAVTGACLYRTQLPIGTTAIPLRSGFYVVSCKSTAGQLCKTVSIK